jgi:carbon storage regulator
MKSIKGLVLSRKEGERISIGDEITIEVVKIYSNRVTIQIDAPKHLKILRTELLRNEDQQGQGSTSETDPTLRRERGREIESCGAVPKPAIFEC